MITIDKLKAATDIPVILVDEEGIILHINQFFENTWGWHKKDLIGRPLTTIISENLKDAHHMGFSRFLLTGRPKILGQSLKLFILRPDGKEEVAEHFIIAEKVDTHWIIGAIIKPLG